MKKKIKCEHCGREEEVEVTKGLRARQCECGELIHIPHPEEEGKGVQEQEIKTYTPRLKCKGCSGRIFLDPKEPPNYIPTVCPNCGGEMVLRFLCPECRKKLNTEPSTYGQESTCPGCSAKIKAGKSTVLLPTDSEAQSGQYDAADEEKKPEREATGAEAPDVSSGIKVEEPDEEITPAAPEDVDLDEGLDEGVILNVCQECKTPLPTQARYCPACGYDHRLHRSSQKPTVDGEAAETSSYSTYFLPTVGLFFVASIALFLISIHLGVRKCMWFSGTGVLCSVVAMAACYYTVQLAATIAVLKAGEVQPDAQHLRIVRTAVHDLFVFSYVFSVIAIASAVVGLVFLLGS